MACRMEGKEPLSETDFATVESVHVCRPVTCLAVSTDLTTALTSAVLLLAVLVPEHLGSRLESDIT